MTTRLGSRQIAEAFSWPARVARMLEVEAALADAQAELGLIPNDAAVAIGEACDPDTFDLQALEADAERAGTPVAPLVQRLRDVVSPLAKEFVHAGTTTQDIVDTAMVLQVRQALSVLDEELLGVARSCARIAAEHRDTPMVGRTLLQQAGPVSFGAKVALWLHALTRSGQRLRASAPDVLVVQLGGAVGTLATMGERGADIITALAERLGLGQPELPWQTNRDRMSALAAELGILAGVVGKAATDLVLLAQSEVAEVHEADPGRSSALPHKRNPVRAIAARAAAQLALGEVTTVLASMVQEHERAAGAWWSEAVAVPSLFSRCGGAVEHLGAALDHLQVDAQRMRDNLEASHGLAMAEPLITALAPALGWVSAQQLVGRLCSQAVNSGRALRAVAEADSTVMDHLTPEESGRVFDPVSALGMSSEHVDRALAAFERYEAADTSW